MKTIQDIEKMHELLVECRDIFRKLGGDSAVDASRMERACNRIDSLIGLTQENGSVDLDKDYWSN